MATKKPKTKIEKAIEAEFPEKYWKAAKAAVRSAKPIVDQYDELRAEEQELAAKSLKAIQAFRTHYMQNDFKQRQDHMRKIEAMPATTYKEIEARYNTRSESVYDAEYDRLKIAKNAAEFELAACRKKIERLQNKLGI